jgi:N-acetylglucosaminyl-diphospho-decaprenol L-rhamnosyltransferase
MMRYGLYDEDIFLYSEELILGYKLKNSGYKSLLLITDTYIHHHSVSIDKTYSSYFKKKKKLLESKMFYLIKYQQIPSYLIVLARLYFTFTLIEAIVIDLAKSILFLGKNKNIK